MPRSPKEPQIEGALVYKGFSKSQFPGIYIAPNRRRFRFGHTTGKSMAYYFGDFPIANQLTFMPLELAQDIIDNLEKGPDPRELHRAQRTHQLYKPGGLGYLFLKQQTKVGKSQAK